MLVHFLGSYFYTGTDMVFVVMKHKRLAGAGARLINPGE
jgi:hypothetical protein